MYYINATLFTNLLNMLCELWCFWLDFFEYLILFIIMFSKLIVCCNFYTFSFVLFHWNSGQDSESNRLENSTWTDVKVGLFQSCSILCLSWSLISIWALFITMFCIQVADSVTKYCILLHILEGSADAAQFSAICILH